MTVITQATQRLLRAVLWLQCILKHGLLYINIFQHDHFSKQDAHSEQERRVIVQEGIKPGET